MCLPLRVTEKICRGFCAEVVRCCVQVLHFVGHRKKTLKLVHKAYMQGGLQGMYQMLSMLPHSEQDYAELDLPALEQYLMPETSAALAA